MGSCCAAFGTKLSIVFNKKIGSTVGGEALSHQN